MIRPPSIRSTSTICARYTDVPGRCTYPATAGCRFAAPAERCLSYHLVTMSAMSMIGEYLRVTPTEMERAIQDPQWAYDYTEEVQDAQEEIELAPHEARHFSTHKAWDFLGFLLRRSRFPVDIVHGEQSFAEDQDWGYGPPKLLSAERVRLAAEALRSTSYDSLIDGVDPAELFGVYPGVWDQPDALEWGRSPFDSLAVFINAAAAASDALLIWLD